MPNVNIIGYGAIARAVEVRLKIADRDGKLMPIGKVSFFAPEIKESCTEEPELKKPRIETVFNYHNCGPVGRDTFKALLDKMNLAPGDVVLDLAARIDTVAVWHEVKRRNCHFLCTAFDVWADLELDLMAIDNMRSDPVFSKGSGPTSVFGMGMNPGIVNHFVAHGLKAATGLDDVAAASEEFGLSSYIFSERDNQWPKAGSAAEKLVTETQEDVLYCSWSPNNYLVETRECKLLYPGMPKEASEMMSVDSTLVSWVPSGPMVGFAPPHDETFTTQKWFNREIPALFIYESPPPARFFLKGKNMSHSSNVPCKLFTPAQYELREDCYDTIGVILLSSKHGREPFWCGLSMNVGDAAEMDSTGGSGPTALQVMAGVWTSLQYIISHPQRGDCFPEDLPTDFVISTAFPWAGRLLARPCPEALTLPGFFDPAASDAFARLKAGAMEAGRVEVRTSSIHGSGSFATKALLPGTVVAQLALSGPIASEAAGFNHCCCPNAYVDRNHAIRTMADVAQGEEVTIDYAMTAARGSQDLASASITTCNCGAASCRKSVSDWAALPAGGLLRYMKTLPIMREVEEDIHAAFASTAF